MRRLIGDSLIPLALAAGLVFLAAEWNRTVTPVNKVVSYEHIQRNGYLRVLTRNNPVTYYVDRDGFEAGFEYDLVTDFAQSVGLEPRFIVKNSVAGILRGLASGEGDIAVPGLSITDERKRHFLFGPVYKEVSKPLVCRRGGANPKNLQQLQQLPREDLHIVAGSSYEVRLNKLKNDYPGLEWTAVEGASAEDLLKKVWGKDVGCTIVDSNILAINQRYYPELKIRFPVGDADSVAWVMPNGAEDLQAAVGQWFRDFSRQGGMASLQERYYGHVDVFDYVDTAAFIRRIVSRYTHLQPYFKRAAEEYGFSETLLASQAYQESHWNPYATSPTGVRGVMMLTINTAKSVGVEDRLDIEQSIWGGAQYLAQLRKMFSRTITEPDLTWFALVAYNIGLGHVRDAQTLARRMKLDSTKWHHIKEVLPLLSQRRHYKTLRYGYARGSDSVRYVQQIREYEQILAQQLGTLAATKIQEGNLEL